MKRPKEFWAVPHLLWNYSLEEVGLICIQILEQLISSKTLLLEMILKVGKLSNKWRFKSPKMKENTQSKLLQMIPKTMTKCAQILLAEGDAESLQELFKEFRNNMRNVSGEKTLILYRVVAGMIEKRSVDDSSDAISLGGTSFGTSFTNKSSGPNPDQIISEVKIALKDKRDVDWMMPLFAWYVMDEKSADDVKDILTQYRDDNLEHLPAHQHLLQFLFQEYEDETEILLEELKLFSEQFLWDENVLRYCKLLVKKAEDDDLENSFDSVEENENNTGDMIEKHMEVFEIVIKFLDYEMNVNDRLAWDLLATSLQYLRSNLDPLEDHSFFSIKFEDRGGWWLNQNFRDLDQCDTNVLVKKGMVAAYLYSSECDLYCQALVILQSRYQTVPSHGLSNLIKELTFAGQTSTPCIQPWEKDFSGVDRRWNKREWRKLEHIEKDFSGVDRRWNKREWR